MDASERAKTLGISREAMELYLASDVIDLHVDAFIWQRILGRTITARHGTGPFGARFLGHADLPRLRDAGLTGVTWVMTTNPLRSAAGRRKALSANLRELSETLAADPGVRIVRTRAEFAAARRDGMHAAFLGIQGGNAVGDDLDAVDEMAAHGLLRVTLVHLTSSNIGTTSAPLRLGSDGGLTDFGRALVERLDAKHIFVDLAHASRKSFFDAVDAHDPSLPLIVTHTGVSGVHPHWRNLDDEQLRAVADSGGTVGVMYEVSFLGPSRGRVTTETVVDHLAHIVRTVGEDHASLGSDWDGAITTPRDMPTCFELPRLVDAMLRRGFTTDAVRKILGLNFLRSLEYLRG